MTQAATVAPTPGIAANTGANSGKGIGSVDHIDLAALDESPAPAGQATFQLECSACHELEERYTTLGLRLFRAKDF